MGETSEEKFVETNWAGVLERRLPPFYLGLGALAFLWVVLDAYKMPYGKYGPYLDTGVFIVCALSALSIWKKWIPRTALEPQMAIVSVVITAPAALEFFFERDPFLHSYYIVGVLVAGVSMVRWAWFLAMVGGVGAMFFGIAAAAGIELNANMILIEVLCTWIGVASFRQKRRFLTEVYQLQESERLKAEEAIAAHQTKSQFLANMSHELRTPLHAIIGYAQMLEESAGEEGRGEEQKDLKVIEESGQELLSMINEILDLSKIEAGKLAIKPSNVHVQDFCKDLERTALPLASKNGNEIQVSVTTRQDFLFTDGFRLKQCLLNLLSNAAKFTKDGTLAFSVRDATLNEEDALEFQVRDDGIGMSDEQAGRVFEAFSQATDEVTEKYGGTGLGLTITKELVEMLGGQMELESRLGAGSTFRILLPVAGAA